MPSQPHANASHTLAHFLAEHSGQDIPPAIQHEAKRSLVNYFAVALAGSQDPTLGLALQTYLTFSCGAQASIIGHAQRTDMLNAAALNAMSANVHDYDDTHIPTILHPTAPVAAALFALAQTRPVHGRDFLAAFIMGVELECRIANAVSPFHYANGWHITSTCGVFGAAGAAGRILGLSARQQHWAMGNAAAQAGGLVECLGTMSKSTSVGNAARNGLMAALLGQNNFTGPDAPLEGTYGFVRVFGQSPDLDALTSGLGRTWELSRNTYKPYPCGVVLNPVLDACLALRQSAAWRTDSHDRIRSIQLTGHPLLRQRTDRPDIRTGRESQVCAQHAIAVSLIRGKAGLAQFSDAEVNDPILRRLGAKVQFVDDAHYSVDSVQLRITLDNGDVLTHVVDAARGSLPNPLSDADLADKLATLQAYSGVRCDTEHLLDRLWQLEHETDAGALMQIVAGT